MSIGTVVATATGLTVPTNLYIKLKGKSVYRWPNPLSINAMAQLIDKIGANHYQVHLHHWIKVK